MGGFGSRKPSELSGGQQQRVALARALAAQPKLLLLDEPFSALDENLREDMRKLVLDLQKEFCMTVLLVTHDREEALSMSDRIALLFDGSIAQIGTPCEVYDVPATRQVADYFGDCVYLPGQVRQNIFQAGAIGIPVEKPDGAYDLLLRPRDVLLCPDGDLSAVVTGLYYYGARSAVELELVPGVRLRKYAAALPDIRIGQTVRCRIQSEPPIVFAHSANNLI